MASISLYSDSYTTIAAGKPGSEFAVELWCTPSSGYAWELVALPAPLELVAAYLLAEAELVGEEGVPVRQRFHFQVGAGLAPAERSRISSLSFAYRRPAEPAALKQVDFEVLNAV